MAVPAHLEPKLLAGTLSDDEKKQLLEPLTGQARKEMKKRIYSNEAAQGVSTSGGQQKQQTTERTYPEPLATWRRRLIDEFNGNSAKVAAETCREIFDAMTTDPFEQFLDLYRALPDRLTPKEDTLAEAVVCQFAAWFSSQSNQDELRTKHLSERVQNKAICFFTISHSLHAAAMGPIYGFDNKTQKELMTTQVNAHIGGANYQVAMYVARQHDLRFKFDAFLLPRVLEGAYQEVLEYCKEARNARRREEFIVWLDSLIYHNLDGIEKMAKRYGRELVEKGIELLNQKTLKKHIKSLLSEFDLQAEEKRIAPNYWWFARDQKLAYLIKRRFEESDRIDRRSYVAEIKDLVEGAEETRKCQFIRKLWTGHNEEQKEDACAWAYIFAIQWGLPQPMHDYMEQNPTRMKQIQQSIWSIDPTEDLDNLTVSGKPVVFVDQLEQLQNLMELLRTEPLIGIDSETVAEETMPTKMALLQIALSAAIYLVDFKVFEKSLSREQREEFFEALLKSDGIKLGFDFVNDLTTMTIRNSPKYVEENKNCLCLKRLMEYILQADPGFVDMKKVEARPKRTAEEEEEEAERPISFKLSDLVKKMLHEELDKSYQLSYWAQRPLQRAQVSYAARDAEILIALYQEILSRAEQRGLSLEKMLPAAQNYIQMRREQQKAQSRKRIDNMTWSEIVDGVTEPGRDFTRKAVECRFAVDLMHHGLGKSLRRCGANVHIPTVTADLIQAMRHDEKRILLTSGKSVDRYRFDFPGRVWRVNNTSVDPILLLKEVLQKARVRLDPDEPYSRCLVCNRVGFLAAPSPVVEALRQHHLRANDLPMDLHDWKERLRGLNHAEYNGYGCRVDCKVDPEGEWFHVDVVGGRIDIERCLAIHPATFNPKGIQIETVPHNAFATGRVFFICAHCGRIHYE